MANSKRRCNVCRDYFLAESMIKLGSVWVCSESCTDKKLNDANKPLTPKTAPDIKAAVRKEVIKRDGDSCLGCGQLGPGLHLHRVIYGSQGGKYEVMNCVLLDEVCHNAPNRTNGTLSVHSDKKRFQPLLLAHLAGDKRAKAKLREALRTPLP